VLTLYDVLMRPTSNFFELDRYLAASILSNLIGYIFYVVAVATFSNVNPVLIFAIASTSVLPLSFYLNRMWVFKSRNLIRREFMRFLFGYFSAMIAGVFLLSMFISIFESPFLAQFLSMVTLGLAAFLLHAFWTFKPNP
jgi:putative flippase GtrA